MSEENLTTLAATANQLYWETTRPAGHLAEELGISRSKFYALIEPLRLNVKCKACGALLAFSSRSDREAGRGRCPECGNVAEVPPEAAPPAPEEQVVPPSTEDLPTSTVTPIAAAMEARELWITAIAGVAIGLMAAAWWRRR